MESIPRFYVYILYRPDGRPFYVGKGQGNRIDNHETNAARGMANKCCNTIRKIWRLGGTVLKQKVFETDDEHEAFDMERYLIASIGRENLANVTDGGEGLSGWEPTLEWREKVQAAKLGRPRSEACRAKMRAKLTGRTMPEGWAAKVSAANKGQPWSAAERASIPNSLRVPKPNARGEKHHNAKLTADQVREVRRLYKVEGMGPKAIAERTGIKRGTVKGILYSSRDWKWLNDEHGNIPS